MEKLPDEVVILILNKLHLCKYRDNSNIQTVSKRWNICVIESVKKCEKYNYYSNYQACKQHFFYDIYCQMGKWYDSFKINYLGFC